MGAPTAQQPQKEQKHIHILIIGAGLTGLILAQALRKLQHLASLNTTSTSTTTPPPPLITYEIFERDPRAFFRGGGWSLTIHWALTDLQNLLPDEIMQNFETCLVNRDAAAAGQAGNFQFLNLCTGEIVEAWPIPRGAASRVSREKILELLMRGVDVRVCFRFLFFCCFLGGGEVSFGFWFFFSFLSLFFSLPGREHDYTVLWITIHGSNIYLHIQLTLPNNPVVQTPHLPRLLASIFRNRQLRRRQPSPRPSRNRLRRCKISRSKNSLRNNLAKQSTSRSSPRTTRKISPRKSRKMS